LLAALGIHALTSLLVGSALWRHASDVCPEAHSHRRLHRPVSLDGILYSALGVISPILNARIDWLWFVFRKLPLAWSAALSSICRSRCGRRSFARYRLPFAPACTAISPSDHPHLKDPLKDKDQ
jgi:hypothetical protein